MQELQKPGEPSFYEIYKRFLVDNAHEDDNAENLINRIEEGENLWVDDSIPGSGVRVFNYFAFCGLYMQLMENNGKVVISQLNENGGFVCIAQFTSLSKSKNYANGITYIEEHYQESLATIPSVPDKFAIPEAS